MLGAASYLNTSFFSRPDSLYWVTLLSVTMWCPVFEVDLALGKLISLPYTFVELHLRLHLDLD